MSGFTVEPDVLVEHARRRARDAATLDRVGQGIGEAQADGMALGALCSWVLGDVRESVEAVEELVRALADSSRVLATALHEGARDHRDTDEGVAEAFGEVP